jgi:hypothetical protein
MQWMVDTMMRVDEMLDVRYRDCLKDKNKRGEAIIVCHVEGKRAGRTVIGRRRAAQICVERLEYLDPKPSPDDLIFPVHHREALTELLKAAKLHIDKRTGLRGTSNLSVLRRLVLRFFVEPPLRSSPLG